MRAVISAASVSLAGRGGCGVLGMGRILTANSAGLTTAKQGTYREHNFGEARRMFIRLAANPLQMQPEAIIREAMAHPLT
jgi:hypothetical protein